MACFCVSNLFSVSFGILLWTGEAAGFCASVFETQQDHILLGQVKETVYVTDEFDCHRRCMQNNTCKSFNVHPPKSNTIKKTCEMNNQTRQMKPKQYKKKIGSSYHGSVELNKAHLLSSLESPARTSGNPPMHKGTGSTGSTQKALIVFSVISHSSFAILLWTGEAAGFCASVFETQQDHTLLGQVMETVNVTDEFECHRKCIQNNTCKSFNVHPPKSNAIKKTCELNNQTRQMKPKQYKKKIGSSYHGSVEVIKKGESPAFPGVSCKDIRESTNAQDNGEYWIDPKGTGLPFKVYCDMTTDGGK
ncbi:hypothetical protein P5673_009157, partial [Acropora cervicornis]